MSEKTLKMSFFSVGSGRGNAYFRGAKAIRKHQKHQKMGKIISLIHMSLDGYTADVDGKIDWIAMNEEISNYVTELRQGAAATIYGRKTYQIMESYWPNVPKMPDLPQWQKDYAEWVNKALKVVVSKTLSGTTWNNSLLITDNIGEEVRKVKQEVKGNLLLPASATLVATLLPLGLIDELCITINPIILGSGKGYFKEARDRVPLELMETRNFGRGVVGLRYQVIK
jgi:dihydrofolate reductase